MITLSRGCLSGRRLTVTLLVITIGACGLALAGQGASSPHAQKPDLIRPGDLLSIQVIGTLPEAPIHDVYQVEASGKVPLGPAYGRVQVDGKTPEEAEKIVHEHLASLLQDPKLQITRYDPERQPARSDIQALERRVEKLEEAVRRLQAANEKLPKNH